MQKIEMPRTEDQEMWFRMVWYGTCLGFDAGFDLRQLWTLDFPQDVT